MPGTWHLVSLFHVQPAVQDADAGYKSNSVCTLLSSSINKKSRLCLCCPFTQSHQRQWLVWDHGYAATTAATLLLLLLNTQLSSLPCVEYALMQRKNKEKKDQRKRTNEVCIGTASIRPEGHPYPSHSNKTTPQKSLPVGPSAGDSLVS